MAKPFWNQYFKHYYCIFCVKRCRFTVFMSIHLHCVNSSLNFLINIKKEEKVIFMEHDVKNMICECTIPGRER